MEVTSKCKLGQPSEPFTKSQHTGAMRVLMNSQPLQNFWIHYLGYVFSSQLPGEYISPSQILKKLAQQSRGQFPLALGIWKSSRWKKWGASMASSELQCPKDTCMNRAISHIFGPKSSKISFEKTLIWLYIIILRMFSNNILYNMVK